MGHHRLLPPHPDHLFPPNVDQIENTIAQRAYELFASRGFTNGHDLDDWFLASPNFSARCRSKSQKPKTR